MFWIISLLLRVIFVESVVYTIKLNLLIVRSMRIPLVTVLYHSYFQMHPHSLRNVFI